RFSYSAGQIFSLRVREPNQRSIYSNVARPSAQWTSRQIDVGRLNPPFKLMITAFSITIPRPMEDRPSRPQTIGIAPRLPQTVWHGPTYFAIDNLQLVDCSPYGNHTNDSRPEAPS